MRKTMRRLLPVVVLLTACGDGNEPPPPHDPVSATVLTGNEQQAPVGTQLPLQVAIFVSDVDARSVSDQQVDFVVVRGDGQVTDGSAVTDEEGIARTRWTLGTTAGLHVLEARVVTGEGREPIVATVTATGEPGPAAEVVIAEDEYQLVSGVVFDLFPEVRVNDQYGNRILAAPITLTAPAPLLIDESRISSVLETTTEVTITSGLASATVRVTVLEDLTQLIGAEGTYSCSGRLETTIEGLGDVVLTRDDNFFTIDSIGSGPAGAVATFWTHRTRTVELEDGTTSQFVSPAHPMIVLRHEPGYILFDGVRGEEPENRTRNEREFFVYSGGDFCQGWSPLETFAAIHINWG
jgi:hypothetical protein